MPKNEAGRAAPRSTNGEKSRERLIDAAIALFADHGLHGPSMREINKASGAKNSSSVQYHFGDRFGVIEAVVERVTKPMVEIIHANLDRIAAEPISSSDRVRAIVEAAFGATTGTLKTEQTVKAARVLAMVVEDRAPRINQLFTIRLDPVLARIEQSMADAVPAKSRTLLRLEVRFALVGLLHMVSDLHVLFGMPNVASDAEIRNRINRYYLDFVARGLSSLPS